MIVIKKIKQKRNFIPRLELEVVAIVLLGKKTAEYAYYSVSIALDRYSLDVTFEIKASSEKVEYLNTRALTNHKCTPL
jgi:hypothetical protein